MFCKFCKLSVLTKIIDYVGPGRKIRTINRCLSSETSQMSSVMRVVQEHLGFNEFEAQQYCAAVRFLAHIQVKPEMFEDEGCDKELDLSFSYLKQYLPLSEIRTTEALAILTHNDIVYRIKNLLEIGVTRLRSYHVVNYTSMLNKTIEELQGAKLIDEETNILANYLNIFPEFPQEVKQNILNEFETEDVKLIKLKPRIVKEYLIWRKASVDEIPESLQNNFVESLTGLKAIINMFMDKVVIKEEYNWALWKYLLSYKIDDLNEFVTLLPSLLNLDLATAIQKVPNLVQLNPARLKARIELYNKHGVGIDFLRDHLSYLRFCEKTLRQRFAFWTSMLGEDIFVQYPEAVRLINEHKKSKIAFDRTVDSGYRALPLSLLVNMLLRPQRSSLKENFIHACASFLSKEYGFDKKVIQLKLEEVPGSQGFDIENVTAVCSFLEDKVTKQQLFTSLYIVRFDVKLVEAVYRNFEQSANFNEWKAHPLFLDVIVYYLDKLIDLSKVLTSSGDKIEDADSRFSPDDVDPVENEHEA